MKLTPELLKALGFKYDKEDKVWYKNPEDAYFEESSLKNISLKRFVENLVEDAHGEGKKELIRTIKAVLDIRN